MSRRVLPVTLSEFEFLVDLAGEQHYLSNEPMPRLNEEGIEKIESCLQTPFQKYFGIYKYVGLLSKATILFYLINKNHCLLNGNKRMACITAGFLFFKNGYDLDMSPTTFYHLAKDVVLSNEGEKRKTIRKIKKIFKQSMHPL
jgi:death on curing protein